jgi:hypothetical protein
MEANQPHLKVCRYCSVQSRTASDNCPSCGKPYTRQSMLRPLLVVAALMLALALGYGLTSLIISDDGGGGQVDQRQPPGVIRFEQGDAIPVGTPRGTVLERLGRPLPGRGEPGCVYYAISDQPESVWRFCFRDGRVASLATVATGGAGS